ncbi:MAG: HAMP domain-containing histidine kinase, partial [Pseudomonadales bacterium]|nr:HAMP domain-containing histidine kinase [Pseudomonadales bacterium]
MIECAKILFVVSEKTRQVLHLEEMQNTLAIEADFLEWDEVLADHDKLYDMAVLQCENHSYEFFIDGLNVLVDQGHTPFSRFMIISVEPLTVDLSQAWQQGMHCHVCIDKDVDNVYHSIESFCRLANETKRLSQQLKEASDIAVLSMSASSQLGEIIRFLEKSYECKDFLTLGKLLNETLEMMGITGCGIIETDSDPIYFGDLDREDIWRRLIAEYKPRGRFIDIDNRTITNFDSISVLARNLPEPGSEEHGRIKDVLFTLIEGAEARIQSIATEQKAQIAEKAKVSFLSLMSHELRTPMNSITGFSSLLKRKVEGDTLSKRDIEALGLIDESSNRLMAMISDILELSNINTNTEDEKSRLLIREVMQEPLREAQEQSELKQLGFDYHQEDNNLTADIDKKRLQQVVKKLLCNAVKFTTAGQINVESSSVFDHEKGDCLQIKIKDTGPGFTKEQQAKVFKPFAIGEDYLTRKQDGAGLGLVLAQEFVREMSGSIRLETKQGEGSCFTIIIP